MALIKERLLFCGLTSSAFISPILMIVSLATNYWLFAREKDILAHTTTVTIGGHLPLEFTEANYGLWKMCKITDTSKKPKCELIKNFQGSESEIGEAIKKQIDHCIIPIMLALFIMIISVGLHTYAIIKRKQYYLFLTSGCLVIFAGLSSLTGLIIFISAVNGAVDNKLAKNSRSKEEEPPFKYGYGLSFYCAVLSFLFQEINGICNIYYYIGYHKKKRFQQQSNNKVDTQKRHKENNLMPPISTHSATKEPKNLLKPKQSNIRIIITDESDSGTQCHRPHNRVERLPSLPFIGKSIANHIKPKSSNLVEKNPGGVGLADEEDENDDDEGEKLPKDTCVKAAQTTKHEAASQENNLINNARNKTKKPDQQQQLTKTVSMVSPQDSFEDSYVSSSISSFTSSTSTLKVKSDTNSSGQDEFQFNNNDFFVPDEPSFRFNNLPKSYMKYHVLSPIEQTNEFRNKFYKLKDIKMPPKQTILKINSIDTSDLSHHIAKRCACHPTFNSLSTAVKHMKGADGPPFPMPPLTNISEYNSFSLKSPRKNTLNLKKISSHPNCQSVSAVSERDLVQQQQQQNSPLKHTASGGGYSRSKSDYNFHMENYPYFVTLPIYKIKDNILIEDTPKQPYSNSKQKSAGSSTARHIKLIATKTVNNDAKTNHPNSKAMLNAANEAALATETYLNRYTGHQTDLYRAANYRSTMPDLFWPSENIITSSNNKMPLLPPLPPPRNFLQTNKTQQQANKSHRVYRIRKKIPPPPSSHPRLKQTSYSSALKQTDTLLKEPIPVDYTQYNRPANASFGWNFETNVTFKENNNFHDSNNNNNNNNSNTKISNDAQFSKLKRTTSV